MTNGIVNPTVMAFAPDGRIFVAEQGGRLRVVKNGTLLTAPFVQLSVNSAGERGLIGIALDPNFATNGYLYLYYTTAITPIHNRISRFTANGDVAVADSETVVLDLDPLSSATNHNGGAMHFGQDGTLYVAVGENATPSRAQNLDTYHGKLLRINADGSVPAGNPYADGSEQKKRIWAYGLRNPYTFAVQPGTGRILVNDVGQNAWEEINDATAPGRNFGWPAVEGNGNNAAYTNPVYAYAHGAGDGRGCAITGGTFFNPTSTNYPSDFIGKYFYQDLCNQWINVFNLSDEPARAPFATSLPGNSLSLSTGNDGNLYYLSRNTQALYKIIYVNNEAPSITGQPVGASVSQGQSASFSVSASGTALSYQWRKDGVDIAGATSGTYTITHVVADDAGQYRAVVSNAAGRVTSEAAALIVTAENAPPVATITSPANGTLYRAGDEIFFTGTGTDPEEGTLPASAFSWTVNFHHDTHRHDGPPVVSGAESGSFEIPNEGETSADVWYRLILTVTDSEGLTHQDSVDLDPKVVAIRLASNPSGLQLTLGDQPVTTPYTQNFVSGMLLNLSAPASQKRDNVAYAFSGWTEEAGAGGSIAVPDEDATYTANFITAAASGTVVYLSDLDWTSASSGWGPVRKDRSNGESQEVADDGPPIILNGVAYAKGLGAHSFSSITYQLDGGYDRFLSDVGVDDEAGSNGTVNFQVYLDNVLAYESGNLNGESPTESIDLDVSGKNELTLVVTDADNSIYYDHADWAGARLVGTLGSRMAVQESRLAAGAFAVSVYPNPADDYLTVSFDVDQATEVTVQLMDVTSRRVAVATGRTTAGKGNLRMYVGGLSNGIYSVIVRRGHERVVKKVVVFK